MIVDARRSFKSVAEAQSALDQLASLDVKDNADVMDLQSFLDDCRKPAQRTQSQPQPSAKPTLMAAPPPPPRLQELPAEPAREFEGEAVVRVAKRRSARANARRTWIAAGVMSAMAASVGLYAAFQGFSGEAPAMPTTPIAAPAVVQVPRPVEVPAALIAVPAPQDSAVISAPIAAEVVERIEPGWVSVSAPFDMELYEDGKLLGSTGVARIMLPAGRHDIEVVSEALGYREARTVNVQANKVASFAVSLPKGSISLNAIPWATVTIDGENAGDTPIGNLSLTIGPHEVVFTNPQLGEQRRVITVTQRSPVRFSIDLSKK